MSKERQRTRAAREADRAARLAAEQARVDREKGRPAPTAPVRKLKRQRRYGALPVRLQLGLALGYFLVQFVGWQVLSRPSQRLGLALLSLLLLPLAVVLTRPPR